MILPNGYVPFLPLLKQPARVCSVTLQTTWITASVPSEWWLQGAQTGIIDEMMTTDCRIATCGICQWAAAERRELRAWSLLRGAPRLPFRGQELPSGTAWSKVTLRQLPILWQNINPLSIQKQEADFKANLSMFPYWDMLSGTPVVFAGEAKSHTMPLANHFGPSSPPISFFKLHGTVQILCTCLPFILNFIVCSPKRGWLASSRQLWSSGRGGAFPEGNQACVGLWKDLECSCAVRKPLVQGLGWLLGRVGSKNNPWASEGRNLGAQRELHRGQQRPRRFPGGKMCLREKGWAVRTLWVRICCNPLHFF